MTLHSELPSRDEAERWIRSIAEAVNSPASKILSLLERLRLDEGSDAVAQIAHASAQAGDLCWRRIHTVNPVIMSPCQFALVRLTQIQSFERDPSGSLVEQGYWRDVDAGWREAYSLTCMICACTCQELSHGKAYNLPMHSLALCPLHQSCSRRPTSHTAPRFIDPRPTPHIPLWLLSMRHRLALGVMLTYEHHWPLWQQRAEVYLQ